MTPNGDGAILRRNMWFPLSLKSIRGSIGQHNPKVYMRGFFYCPVQQRRVKAYVTGGIFFLYLWLWGQVVNTDNRPKYWHTKGVGRLNHVQKVFQRGSKREASLRVVYDITLSWMWKATIFVLLGILSNNMLSCFLSWDHSTIDLDHSLGQSEEKKAFAAVYKHCYCTTLSFFSCATPLVKNLNGPCEFNWHMAQIAHLIEEQIATPKWMMISNFMKTDSELWTG